MSDASVQYEVREGVATITLNRPEVHNALNRQMLADLRAALREAEQDVRVRCLVLTGAGKAFCAGQDLRELEEDQDVLDHLREQVNPLVLHLRRMEKPVLAAVNGVAAGAGWSLALACDLRMASSDARFLTAFTQVGLVPDAGSTYFLPRLVGLGRAFELCALSDPLSAEEALRWGLVNWVVPADELRERAGEVARRLALGPTRAYGLLKRALLRSLEADLPSVLEYEAMLQKVASCTEDHREGRRAFWEKRPPHFTGC
ncbi:MAG: enoyl-CoA hydratase-related protein [Armatimonadota bacterium]|nr:enoyl-CoA hydratase-related protein [Armatimonadota bacterium]MDR7440312.1 enoyl-CoA hydratase-related protein [Armatimonadota bacterium]MDR7600918.1 enoyl-CoA hydratase-related protein [Armatimonadota bacterium]